VRFTGDLKRKPSCARPGHPVAFGLLLVLFCMWPTLGQPYAEKTHSRLTELGLAADPALFRYDLTCPTAWDLAQYRLWLENQFQTYLEPAVLKRYQTRFPDGSLAKPLNFRRLLGHNQEPELFVVGIDRPPICGKRANAAGLLMTGSRLPDDDKRNRNRIYRLEDGSAPLDKYGRTIPIDPAIINMGAPTGISSQAHAHYALPDWELNSRVKTLKNEPHHFAAAFGWRDGEVETFAHDQAQLHYDLATLTMYWPHPTHRALAFTHLGACLHYVEDAANPIHNVQIGLYEFFRKAKIWSIYENLLSGGGAFASRLGFVQRGLNILTSHHLISEHVANVALFADIEDPELEYSGFLPEAIAPSPKEVVALSAESPLIKSQSAAEPIRAMVHQLARIGAPEGATIYRHTFAITTGSIHRGGYAVPDDERELKRMITGNRKKALPHLEALEASFRTTMMRAIVAVHLLVSRFNKAFQPVEPTYKSAPTSETILPSQELFQQTLNRFMSQRLDMLDAEDSRRAQYLKKPPAPRTQSISWLFVLIDSALLMLLAFIIKGLQRLTSKMYRPKPIYTPIKKSQNRRDIDEHES